MAFMAAPARARGDDDADVPILAYNAKTGRLGFHERVQDDAGKWFTQKTDVTQYSPAFAIDFGRLETGWIHFADRRKAEMILVPCGAPVPPEPPPPGSTREGKPIRFKAGFRVPAIGRELGGIREFAGNSGALINAMNRLHDAYEAAPEARAGRIPVVKMTGITEVKSGQSSSFEPIFTIQQWVDRPAALGPRIVAAPGAPPGGAPSRTADLRAEYTAATARPRTAASATRPPRHVDAYAETDHGGYDAPPDDRWGGGSEPPPYDSAAYDDAPPPAPPARRDTRPAARAPARVIATGAPAW
jgi:hypothetical protein